MRLLLIAYDFPPVPSPQSLRWAYLVRELALAGHEVHVLAPDVPGYGRGGLPVIPPTVTVHRVFPGPLMGFLAARQRRQMGMSAKTVNKLDSGQHPDRTQRPISWKTSLQRALLAALRAPSRLLTAISVRLLGKGLNWKGGLVEAIKAVYGWCMFPDARSEWMPWARRTLDRVLDEISPDAVITSHEPANTIALGIHARRRGFRWIADLGDPVLAPYTPRRWRRKAKAVERALCERADVVTVTSTTAAATLEHRHDLPAQRCEVLTQGFDGTFAATSREHSVVSFDPTRLELLYTGSFYKFRRIVELLDAVIDCPSVRLSIATVVAPPEVARAAKAYPDRIRLLGFLAHREALAAQRRCDVLINLANDDPVQVPGKLYEYLGAGKPVLHLGGQCDDAASTLLRETGVGTCVPRDRVMIRARLLEWIDCKSRGEALLPGSKRSDLSPYQWDSLALRMASLCADRGA